MEWWLELEELTVGQVIELRRDLSVDEFWDAVAWRLPCCLNEPGWSAIHRLASETATVTPGYLDPGPLIHLDSDDPIVSVEAKVFKRALVAAAFAMGAIAGIAVVFPGGQRLHAVGRESNVKRWLSAWEEASKDVHRAATVLPEGYKNLPDELDRMAVERLILDPDRDLRLANRRSQRPEHITATNNRVNLLGIQHEVALQFPLLREVPKRRTRNMPEVILRTKKGKLRLGGVVWTDAFYEHKHHRQILGLG